MFFGQWVESWNLSQQITHALSRRPYVVFTSWMFEVQDFQSINSRITNPKLKGISILREGFKIKQDKVFQALTVLLRELWESWDGAERELTEGWESTGREPRPNPDLDLNLSLTKPIENAKSNRKFKIKWRSTCNKVALSFNDLFQWWMVLDNNCGTVGKKI